MSATTVMLRTYRARKDGTYPVVIRIYAGKTIFEYTGFSVKKNQFRNKPGGWIYGHPDAVLINSSIEAKRREIVARIDEKAGYIKAKASALTSLSKYLDDRAEQFKAMDKIDMGRKLRRMKTEIEEMAGREVFFQELSLNWARTYYTHCKAQYGNTNNTIMRKIKNLRTLYKQAVTDGLTKHPNPFEAFMIHLDPVNRKKLTLEEIQQLEALKLSGIMDLARDLFIFAFYCHGMRFGTLFRLEWKQIKAGTLIYQMDKGKKFRTIALHPKALAILKKYKRSRWVFPLCKREWKNTEDYLNMKGSANSLINAALKNIAAIAELDKPLSTHLARHSFAYLMKKKKVDMHVIKDALGHTNMGTTESYLDSLDDDIINAEIGKAFDL